MEIGIHNFFSDSPQLLNCQTVEGIWEESGASPEYLAAMRLALHYNEETHAESTRLSFLTGLCCQAAGGDPNWVKDVSIAWSLLYGAAHLFDVIQDQDQLDPRLQEIGAAAVINVACGLVISGLAVLNRLYQRWTSNRVAGEISNRFYNVGIRMSSGQHHDLVRNRPGLKEWFEIAEAKSGSFFGLACWAGARFATDDAMRLESFSQFGSHLGVLLQIHDDLADLGDLNNKNKKEPLKGIIHSLPVAYALEVCPEEAQKRLLDCLRQAPQKKGTSQLVFDLLEQNGAALYLKIEIERRRKLAQAALEIAKPDPSVQDELFSYLNMFQKDENKG